MTRSQAQHRPKPPWLRISLPSSTEYNEVRKIIREQRLHTVCSAAACPNAGECWARRHAAFMILGELCTRNCAFCNVQHGKPCAPDSLEPERLAESVAQMGLSHAVITSVTRDDLGDGGAAHFAACVRAIHHRTPDTTVEVLTPDFKGKNGALEIVLEAEPEVFNHNLETVQRLYPTIRKGASYQGSLALLRRAKEIAPRVFTKSGIMVGIGEQDEEIARLMDDLRQADVDFITIGQYLQPSRQHEPVDRYVHPDAFAAMAEMAKAKGFLMVAASPLTRSSYHADADFSALKAARERSLSGHTD